MALAALTPSPRKRSNSLVISACEDQVRGRERENRGGWGLLEGTELKALKALFKK